MTVFLVRHADAKSRANWSGKDADRPLTRKGEAQAWGLVDLLHDSKIKRVLSSPAVRCTDTVTPLASKMGVPVHDAKVLLEGSEPNDVYELLRTVAAKGGDSVLCTHGDLVPELLRLASRDGLTLADTPRWPKGSTWALDVEGERFTKARYLPPPA